MKRYRRMMSLDKVTDSLIQGNQNSEFRMGLLRSLPTRVFGESIAHVVRDVRFEEESGVLYLQIPDDTWRKELKSQIGLLYKEARKIHNAVSQIVLCS